MELRDQFRVALVWPPLCERFVCLRFGPRMTVMSQGYFETQSKDIEDVVCCQINLNERIHHATQYWEEIETAAVSEDDSIIEQYFSGNYKSELLDKVYEFLLKSHDWAKLNLIAVGYDINYLHDNYTPAFYRFLKTMAEEYHIPVLIGGMGPPSVEIIQYFKRFKFLTYMAFGTVDSINLDSFKKIILYEKDRCTDVKEIQNISYRNEQGKVKTNIYDEAPRASVESSCILKPTYHLSQSKEFRTKYADLRKFDPGFPKQGFSDSTEVAVIPYRFTVGCINKCAFCMSSAKGKIFAAKPAEKVADDIDKLIQENNSNCFMFLNSMINFSKKYLGELLNIMKKRKLEIYFTDSAEVHGMDAEMLQMIKELGGIGLWYGLECPSDRILKLINKRCTVDEAVETLKRSDSMGIWNGVNLIAGLPHERDEDINGTAAFIRNSVDFVEMWQVTPFYLVNSRFLEDPDKYGIVVKDRAVTIDKGQGDMVMATFDEVGGLSWNEKQKKTLFGFQLFLETIEKYSKVPSLPNATFLFHAYKAFGKNGKAKIREWLHKNYVGKAPEVKITGLF